MTDARRFAPLSFDPVEPVPAAAARAIDDDALAAARDEGRKAGFAEAMQTIAAHDRLALERIAAALETERQVFRDGLAEARARASETAAAFLEHYASALATARECEAAAALVDRLIAAPGARPPAVLRLNPLSLARLGARLAERIAAAGASDLITVEPGSALEPGEVRLEWRGGEAAVSPASIAKAARDLVADDPSWEDDR